MSKSGSRTRWVPKTIPVINAGNLRNESNHRSDQTQAKHHPVPAWEKQFCFHVGGVPWKKVLEAKKYQNLYQGVMSWDDSAGKKAFDDAKARFRAEINGRRSNAPPPDPNMYIDENIDWESEIEPELLSELQAAIDKKNGDVKKVVEVRLEDIVPTGWEIFDDRDLTGMVVGDKDVARRR